MPGVRLSTLVRRMRREAPAGDSDPELLARFARGGDSAAFELLVWRHGVMVLAACRRVLRNGADAEDAFQAVFLVLARKAGSIGRGTALPAWLHRVAVRVSTRLARSRRVTVPLEMDVLAKPSPDAAVMAETLGALDEEIDRLPDRCRRAVVLCYLEGLTAAEAARRLGCPTGTVESRLAAARKRLCAALTRRGVTLPAGIFAAVGSVVLGPEVVARVARAGLLFGRGEFDAVVSEQSVRLAKGVLAMSRTKTWTAVLAVALAALTVTAGIAWANREPDAAPPTLATEAVPPDAKTEPRVAEAEPRSADPLKPEYWSGKPVWVASTVATLYDVSPDGKRFLMSDHRKFGVFDRDSGKMIWEVDNSTIHDAKFSPDGKTVAAGEWQNGVNFYDAASGKKLHAIPAGEERPWQVHYRPDGTLLYHTSWSSLSNQPPWTLKYSIVHFDPVAKKERGKVSDTITYSTTNPWLWHRGAGFFMERLQIFGTDKTTRRIVNYTDPITGKVTPTLDLHVNDITLDVSPDGKTLLVMTAGESPRLIDTTTGKTVRKLEGNKRFATGGAFSPDGKLVVVVTGTDFHNSYRGVSYWDKIPDGPAEYVVWEAATGKLVARAEFPIKDFDFTSVTFSPDSKFFVATSKEGPRGKSKGTYAFGAVPFDKSGGVALNFPRDEELKPKPPAVVAPKAGIVGDPLDRLVEELARSNKTAAEKVDALFLAALGRFASVSEQKRVKDKYGEKLTADALNKLLAEIAATPEYDAHIRSLIKRSPSKPGTTPGFPQVAPGSVPFGPGNPLPGLDQTPYGYPNGWSQQWSFPRLGPPPDGTPKKP